MNIITFIMSLLEKYTPVDDNEMAKTWQEAKNWYNTTEGDQKGDLKQKIKWVFEQWWCKIALAVLWIPANRWIQDIINPPKEEIFQDSEF